MFVKFGLLSLLEKCLLSKESYFIFEKHDGVLALEVMFAKEKFWPEGSPVSFFFEIWQSHNGF